MFHINVNMTSLAVILWSGMLIIAGSIWVLSAQVRKVADLMEDHSRRIATEPQLSAVAKPAARVRNPRAESRRATSVSTRRAYQAGAITSRN